MSRKVLKAFEESGALVKKRKSCSGSAEPRGRWLARLLDMRLCGDRTEHLA